MTFASIADIEALKEQVRSLNLLVLLLPEVNQRVLKVSNRVKGRQVLDCFSPSLTHSLTLTHTHTTAVDGIS